MKKFDIKSILVGLVVGVSLFGCVNAASVLAENVYFSQFPIVVNGKSYASGSAILNYMGSTYVPLKELGELTGSTVTFNNNTIYVNNKTTGNVNANINTNYYPTTSSYEIELDEDETENVFVNLAKYNAKSAIVSYTNNCIYASKVYFNSNGTFTVRGVEEGSTTLTIRYDTGAVEYIYVTVEGNEEEEELEIEVGDYEYIDIDLDDYDADKATLSITKGSSYITLNKTKVTNDTSVKVTGDKKGSATIKIKYDTGEIEYVYVDVVDDDNEYDYNDFEYVEEIDVEVDDYETYYINLEKHNAVNAELSVISGKNYISLGKSNVVSSDSIKIYGDEEGESIIKVKYSTGEVEYIWIEIED